MKKAKILNSAARCLGGIFDYDSKAERLEEVLRQMEDPSIWQDQKFAQELGQEKASLEKIVSTLSSVSSGVNAVSYTHLTLPTIYSV